MPKHASGSWLGANDCNFQQATSIAAPEAVVHGGAGKIRIQRLCMLQQHPVQEGWCTPLFVIECVFLHCVFSPSVAASTMCALISRRMHNRLGRTLVVPSVRRLEAAAALLPCALGCKHRMDGCIAITLLLLCYNLFARRDLGTV